MDTMLPLFSLYAAGLLRWLRQRRPAPEIERLDARTLRDIGLGEFADPRGGWRRRERDDSPFSRH